MLVKKVKKSKTKGVSKKSFKKNADILKTRKYEGESDGALNPNYFVKALMKSNGVWHWAKIIECRPTEKTKSGPAETRDKGSYDYYIHYIEFDRRMDEWISIERISATTQYIDSDPLNGTNAHDEEHEGLNKQDRLNHEEATKLKTISSIQLGPHKSETWYYSPYPEPYHNIDCIFYCEYCLSFYVSEQELQYHELRCPLTHPPGNQIYQDDKLKIAVFEVDGYKNYVYCENLCYMSKLFLDHKLLTETMEAFLFYILCEVDKTGCHIVGYFSKYKDLTQCNNN
jgi:hypothetical protein